MLSNDFVSFDLVKKSVTILQILDHYGVTASFTKKGDDSLVGPCPIHEGSNATCFRVSVSKNCFNCFGQCKAGGNILDLVSKKESVSIRKAALLIQEWFHLVSPTEAAEKPTASKQKAVAKGTPATGGAESSAPNPPLPFVLKNLDPNHPSIVGLGLTEETRKTFGLGFCAKGLLADYIAIPIHNQDGLLVAYAGRWPGEPPQGKEKHKFPPGFRKSVEVFNLRRVIEAKEPGPLIVVKDCLNCIKLWQTGCHRAVAILDNAISKVQIGFIENAVLSDGHIVLLFDENEVGRVARAQIAGGLCSCSYVKAPSFATEGTLVEGLTDAELQACTG